MKPQHRPQEGPRSCSSAQGRDNAIFAAASIAEIACAFPDICRSIVGVNPAGCYVCYAGGSVGVGDGEDLGVLDDAGW